MNIDIKLKSYDELQFEIIRLNNDNYLKQITINKQKEVLDDIRNIIKEILERFDKIPDKELLTNRCVDIEVIEEINNKIGAII